MVDNILYWVLIVVFGLSIGYLELQVFLWLRRNLDRWAGNDNDRE